MALQDSKLVESKGTITERFVNCWSCKAPTVRSKLWASPEGQPRSCNGLLEAKRGALNCAIGALQFNQQSMAAVKLSSAH